MLIPMKAFSEFPTLFCSDSMWSVIELSPDLSADTNVTVGRLLYGALAVSLLRRQ
jgi:hypothetical protein